MSVWLVWIIAGIIVAFLELIVPGGIVFFLGMSAVLVGGALYLGLVNNLIDAFTAWFVVSLVSILVLRSLFLSYFEGDSKIQNVNEDLDLVGALAEVTDEIQPYKDGRVRFRETTWTARSDNEILVGIKVRVVRRDGNCLIVENI